MKRRMDDVYIYYQYSFKSFSEFWYQMWLPWSFYWLPYINDEMVKKQIELRTGIYGGKQLHI